MLTKDKGIVRSMKLPDGFVLSDERVRGMSWCTSYCPFSNKAVEISVRSSGKLMSELDTAELNKVIGGGERILFNIDSAREEENLRLVRVVSPLLGNAGDNSVFNTWSEYPQFELEHLECVTLKGRAAFKVIGYFMGMDNLPTNYFCGFFVPLDLSESQMQAQEIYLQAFPKAYFEEYFDAFENCVHSIMWAH